MEFWDQLTDAYLDNNLEHQYYLDLETGLVIFESPYSEELIDWDEEENIDRYVSIPQITSEEAFYVMMQFTKRQTNERVSDKLFDALEGRKPFRRFKDTFYELGIENDWYAFEKAHAETEVKDWIEGRNLPAHSLIETVQ